MGYCAVCHHRAFFVCDICPAQNTQSVLLDGAPDLPGDSHLGYMGDFRVRFGYLQPLQSFALASLHAGRTFWLDNSVEKNRAGTYRQTRCRQVGFLTSRNRSAFPLNSTWTICIYQAVHRALLAMKSFLATQVIARQNACRNRGEQLWTPGRECKPNFG
jgi:hypothetical protein